MTEQLIAGPGGLPPSAWVVEQIVSPPYTTGGMLYTSSLLPHVQQAYMLPVTYATLPAATVIGTLYTARVIQDHTFPGGTISGTLGPAQFVILIAQQAGSVLPMTEAGTFLPNVVLTALLRGA